jgi:hypothetical protein
MISDRLKTRISIVVSLPKANPGVLVVEGGNIY